MSMWRPDPTFYPSPKMAMQAPAEKLAFVAMLNGKDNGHHDALGVVDVDPASSGYGNIVGQVDMRRLAVIVCDASSALKRWNKVCSRAAFSVSPKPR